MNNRPFEKLMSVPAAESLVQGVTEPSPAEGLESVSVVIPCYNEERFIGKALDQLADQFESERYEIIVVDGLSEDRTRMIIEEFKQRRPDLIVSLVDNPSRIIPTALNLGISAARGNIIARMDAHAAPSQGYIRRCVEVLTQDDAGVAGMPCLVRPGANTLVARVIAAAVSHPFGIGDAKYRLRQGEALQEPVDTVAFACFRKSLWATLGGYNESLLTNEDYDFNYRVRQYGKQVILDRSGHSDYFARTTFSDLGRQYLRYGYWKAQMVKLHPGSIKLRQLVAPLFVLSVLVLAVSGIFWRMAWVGLAIELILYFALALYFGLQVARRNKGGWPMGFLMPLVFLTIHWSWGISFLAGLVRGVPRRARVAS